MGSERQEDVRAKRGKESQALVPAQTGPDTNRLLGDLRTLIDAARDQVSRAVNAGLVLLYWGVGERIRREILGEQRATYGEQIVATVSAQLTAEYGRGFAAKTIWRMIQLGRTTRTRRRTEVMRLVASTTLVHGGSDQLAWPRERTHRC